jgi:hypothetical protein
MKDLMGKDYLLDSDFGTLSALSCLPRSLGMLIDFRSFL